MIGFLKSLFDPLSFKQTLSTALMSAGFLVWAVCVCVCVCVCPRWCQRHKTLTFPLVGITDSCYRHMENFQTEHFLKTNTKLQVHSAKSTPDPFQPGCLLRRRENSTLLVQPTLNLFFPPHWILMIHELIPSCQLSLLLASTPNSTLENTDYTLKSTRRYLFNHLEIEENS